MSRSASPTASVAITPGPPALVTIATLSVSGSGWLPRMPAESNSSSTDSARMTPA